MPVLTDNELHTFLGERGILMRIAVVRDDGSPLVTPIWFIHQAGNILFTPREKSEWFKCLRRDPRVSLCIDEQPHPYRKVLIDGTAELVHDIGNDDEWRNIYRDIAKRYVDDEGAEGYIQNTINEPRGLYKVALSDAKVRTWRMPIEGEDPEGIWHSRYYQDPGIKFGG